MDNYKMYLVYRLDPPKNRYQFIHAYQNLREAKEFCESQIDDLSYMFQSYLIKAFSLERGPFAYYLYHGGLLDRLQEDPEEGEYTYGDD